MKDEIKFTSEYFDKDFKFETYQREQYGRLLTVISHDALENAVHNQLSGRVEYSYEIASADTSHSVVICKMVDTKTNRSVIGIGESIPNTLESTISKNYPTLIATQRAFDRAAIRFLALPGKIFSETELPDVDSIGFDEEVIIVENDNDNNCCENGGISSRVVDDVNSDYDMTSVVIDNDTNSVVDEEPVEILSEAEVEVPVEDVVVEEEPVEVVEVVDDVADVNTSNTTNEQSTPNSNAATHILSVKKYKDKHMTVEEIYKIDQQYITWLASGSFTPRDEIAKLDKQMCVEYINSLK